MSVDRFGETHNVRTGYSHGLDSLEVTAAAMAVGAVDTALAIATGLKELQGELRALLNSEESTARCEAMIDTRAIAGASTAIAGRLQQTGSKAISTTQEK